MEVYDSDLTNNISGSNNFFLNNDSKFNSRITFKVIYGINKGDE